MCNEHPCPLSPHFRLWRMLEVPDLDLASWSWFRYGHWFFIYLYSEFWLSLLIWKVLRTYMSFKPWFGALVAAGGSRLGFHILTLIWIWSLVFDTPIFQIFTLTLDFKSAKSIHVLQVRILGFGGHWMFLTEFWNIDHDLDMVPGLWYNLVPNFVPLSLF